MYCTKCRATTPPCQCHVKGTAGVDSNNGLLCSWGWHRPLKNHKHSFIDRVSGATVFNAECGCGKKWMVDSCFGFFGDKVERA